MRSIDWNGDTWAVRAEEVDREREEGGSTTRRYRLLFRNTRTAEARQALVSRPPSYLTNGELGRLLGYAKRTG